jgi:TetR/AcrR family tetracycline transcriptional repressor
VSAERQEQIVRAALRILDDDGLEAVSLRAVAKALDVHLNTVSWHVGTKARLRDLMADAVLGEMSIEGLPADWRARLHELSARYRAVLLAHRDGAALVAGTYPPHGNTFRVGEEFVSCLLDAGCDERDAAWACWTVIYFTLGLVQEEQGASKTGPVFGGDVPEDYPALGRAMKHLTDGRFDASHRFGLDLILSALPTRP